MGARVINLAEIRASRAARKAEPASVQAASLAAPQLTSSFHFWSGASGRRYVHTVYNLVDCPEVPQGNFMLVHRDARGRRTILALGHLSHATASLNLAELRQRGARLGANEVHVHLLAENAHQRRVIELDLRAAANPEIADDRVAVTRH